MAYQSLGGHHEQDRGAQYLRKIARLTIVAKGKNFLTRI